MSCTIISEQVNKVKWSVFMTHLLLLSFNVFQTTKVSYSTKSFIYFKFSLINEEIFHVYTKTFGVKIWTSLHRVSPDNFFAKIFNKASFKIPAKKIIKQHLVQKN